MIQALREGASGADGVRMEAIVPNDLEQALLHGGGLFDGKIVGAKDAGSREFQRGVVLARGPTQVFLFDAMPGRQVIHRFSASPEPGENDIDRQFIETTGAEDRDGFGEWACRQRVMAAPEAVGIGAQGVHQGAFGVFGGGSAVDELLEPGGDSVLPVGIGDPGCGQSESALGMIGGAHPVEAPDEGRKGEGAECVAFPPPEVPKDAGACAPLGFGWQKAGEPEKAGFPGITRVPCVGGKGIERGEDFGQALHGPGIVLVAEGPEHAFAEGLAPTRGASASSEDMGFRVQSDQRGLLEEVADPFGRERLNGGGAVAGEPGGREIPRAVDPLAEFVEGRVEAVAEGQRRQRGLAFRRIPRDVEDHIGVGGILEMPMGFPSRRMHIDFDVAGFGIGVTDLDDGLEEVGAGLVIPEAGMEDANGLRAGGEEVIAADALVGPDFLKPALWRSPLSEGLVQLQLRFGGFPPPKVKPLGQRHLLNGHRIGL